ncbi:MAG TPA: hypothetical protein VEP66_17430 [Myxococcales bacterium]|nr:hypothetical protein [Myxococcales bacterium]
MSGLSAPTAATNVPGRRKAAFRNGTRDGVQVTQTSLSATAAPNSPAGVTSIPRLADISAA